MNSKSFCLPFHIILGVLGLIVTSRWGRRTVPDPGFGMFVAALLCCLAGDASGQAPANDNFASPQVITGVFGNAAGTNVNATLETNEPTTTAGRPGGNSVWFRWVAPATGSFTFSLATAFDSQLAVYTGTAVGSLTSISENDPTGLGGDSVTISATEAAVYRIRVSGFQSQVGTFMVNWSGNPVYELVTTFADNGAAVGPSNAGADLVEGIDGNFYGTTFQDGANSYGTIFKMTPAGVLTTLVEFTGNAGSNLGAYPGYLLQCGDGNFYGTTAGGGVGGRGTVFKMTSAGVLTTLVVFYGVNRGTHPNSRLLQDCDGNFYGTTQRGGSSDQGTVFMMTPYGVLTTLVEFTGNTGNNKGSLPYNLVQGNDGNFYGITYLYNPTYVTVFKMTPSGVMTTLIELNSTTLKYPHELVLGGDGNFYGTIEEGGANGLGTIVRMTPAGVFTTLIDFTGATGSNKGRHPSWLVHCSDGNFYGTTSMGGASDKGTVFMMTPAGVLTTLVEFTGSTGDNIGCYPGGYLLQSSDGNFYGMTGGDGSDVRPTTFKMTPTGLLTTLMEFKRSNRGINCEKRLVQHSNGNFYGTTRSGGTSGYGTIFKMTPAGALTTLVNFTGAAGSNKGRYPNELVLGNDGNFYGTDSNGGASYGGTVFRMTPAGVLTTLVEFTGTSGSPFAGLVQGRDGNYYGTTTRGGASGNGMVFRMTPAGVLTTLVEFTGTSGSNKGKRPLTGLVQGIDENFYGTTSEGGSSDQGTVFKMTPSGVLTTLVQFTGTAGSYKGRYSNELAQGNDGNIYGTTYMGGGRDYGTVFKMTPTGVFTTLVEFTTSNGDTPYSGLVQGSDGSFYGTTAYGGANYAGTVFKMTSDGVLTRLHDNAYNAADSNPKAPPVSASDGNLYGTTVGIDGNGTIYRLVFPGTPNVYPLPPEALSPTSAVIQCKISPRGGATIVSLEYGSDGVAFPNSLVIPLSLAGFQSILVGRTLGNLTPGTTYYYRFRATNGIGETLSPIQSVTTLAPPMVAVVPATDILPTSARLNGTVNARNFDTTVRFEWGTDGNSFPNTLPASPGSVTGNSPVPVSAPIAGLVKGTTYYYRIVATNAGGTSVSGTQSLTTLTEPSAAIGGSFALSTTSVRVEGTANARGSSTTVAFEYGTDGVTYNSVPAVPGTIIGEGNTPVSAVLSNLSQGVTYHYRIKVSSAGGPNSSGVATFSMNVLSGFAQEFPDAPPSSQGFIIVNLTPPGVGGWRFVGEQAWRAPGIPVGGLTTSDRVIEFMPVDNYIQPPPEPVSINSGGVPRYLNLSYYSSGQDGSGGLSVTLKPISLAVPGEPGTEWAQWRLFKLGVNSDPWLNSGETLTGLSPGNYLIECKQVAGRTTPSPSAVRVEDGEMSTKTIVYYLNDPQTGAYPLVLPFETVSTSTNLPYGYVGQIRSDVGSSSGFVVRSRVVVTAGHVVFDEETLSTVSGLQWLLQRDGIAHEPKPLIPRGAHLLDDYAAARQAPGAVPGSGTPESQNRDAATLFFGQDAGRGGFSGYLASDAMGNEFLESPAAKILVGYPVSGEGYVSGRMYATAAMNAGFTRVLAAEFGNPFRTYRTSDIRGTGGMSGGPLCVQFEGGIYYPAAIYLGGSDETVVRVIDSKVIDIINSAEVSSVAGEDNTGGGITFSSFTTNSSYTAEWGALRVTIMPAAAAQTAVWWIDSEPAGYPSGSSGDKHSLEVSGSPYTLRIDPVDGFNTPAAQSVEIRSGKIRDITFTFGQTLTALESWRQTHFGTTENEGEAADGEDPDKDGRTNREEYAADTNPKSALDVFKILTTEKSTTGFTATVDGKKGRRYTLQRADSLAAGVWSNVVSIGPLPANQSSVPLTDPNPPPSSGFYRMEVSAP